MCASLAVVMSKQKETEQASTEQETDDATEGRADRAREPSRQPLPDSATAPLQQIVEAALLVSPEPLTIDRLQALFGDSPPTRPQLQKVLAQLLEDCVDRGYELVQVASGWRFQVRQSLAPWISRMYAERPPRYSRALLETLALVAYRQPVTRGDIEEVRGVAVSTGIMRTLLERNWIKVVAHREVPGRPALYGTTKEFLDYFNLTSLEDLPSLGEVRDLDEMGRELEMSLGLDLGDAAATSATADEGIQSAVADGTTGAHEESVFDDQQAQNTNDDTPRSAVIVTLEPRDRREG